MTPQDFIRKWKTHALTERAAAQSISWICAGCSTTRRRPRKTPTATTSPSKKAPRSRAAAGRTLNPPDLVDIVPEVAPGYPDRILPKTTEAAAKLMTRTLTNLYNERPSWLDSAHAELDRAVASAYGWPEDISTEDALARLLALNLERAEKQ